MNRRYLLALVRPRVVEGIAGDTLGSSAGNHLQTRDNIFDNFVLEAGVQVFGIFPKNHHVDLHVCKARFDARQRADRTHIGKEVERLAQRHVDALKAAGNRSGDRAF